MVLLKFVLLVLVLLTELHRFASRVSPEYRLYHRVFQGVPSSIFIDSCIRAGNEEL